MPKHEINVKVNLEDEEARKKLDQLTKEKHKVKLETDVSELDKGVEKLKNKKINVDAKVDGAKDIDKLTSGLNSAKKASDSLLGSFKGITKAGLNIDVFRMIKQEAQEAVKAVKEIDDAIVDLQMATSDSYENVRKLVGGYNSLAKKLGATTTEITSGADDWLRQGKTISETNKLILDSMVLSKDAKLSSADSTNYLTAIMKGYKKSVKEVSDINDSLTSIDLVSATDAGGLAEATSRVAASAELAGISLNKLLGYEAAVGEASQEGMSVIGNSFKTIFARMSDIKANKLELIDDDGTVEKLSDVEIALANVGIDLRKTVNEYNDYEDVLDSLASKWNNLNDAQQKAISKAFAGQRQQNRFQLLMENYNKATEYTNVANNSKGTAMQKFNDAYLNSLGAKQKSLQSSFESLATNTISRDSYAGIIEATQSLVEFLDKTQLVKGAIAGLTVGGLLKGFLSIQTGIVQATVKMQNFQKALELLKVGNIGADEIQKLGIYTDGLSKSQLKAVLSSEQLTAAQRTEILTASGMSESAASAELATFGLATAEGTATASTISLSTAMKGLMATMLANPILLVGTAITAGVSAWQAYKRSVEETNNAARESAQNFIDNSNSLNEQISKVKELKTALSSGTLSDDEEISAKQQLLDIQNQLISTYGQQAEGIDLVNGSLEKELDLVGQLNVQDANKYLNENKSAIDRATSAMEKQRHAYLGQVTPGSTDMDELQRIVDKYKKDGIYTDTDTSTGTVTIHFKGDVTQAEDTLNSFMNDIRTFADNSGDEYGVLNGIADNASSELKEVQSVLDEYQDIYKTALQSDMITKGFGEGKPATVLQEYTEAINAYNDALSGGDSAAIDRAKISFDNVQTSVDGVLKKYPEYKTLFNEIGDTLNDTAVKAKDFNDALKGDDFKNIISQFKDLQDVDLKGISFSDDVKAKGEDALKAVIDKAIELGVVSDDSAESVSTVVDILTELGFTGTKSLESVSDSFEKANTSIQMAVANLSTLKDIMSESMSGGGISADNVKAFREIFGDDAESALEKTANGYHLNEKALAQLQKQQETMTKSDYLSSLADQQEALRKIDEQIAKSQFMGEDISGLQAQRSGIEHQITMLQDLQYQYESATSAYQKWQSAMSGGEEGDMYDSIFAEKEKAKELYDKGLTGTNEFRTFTDLLSSEDLSNATVDQIVAAYERLGQTISGTTHNAMEFSTEGQEGCVAFLDAVSQLNSDWAHMNNDGSWAINFGVGNDKEIADALGIDVEYVQSILRKLSDYGFDINLDQPVASLDKLKTSAQSAKETLESMSDTGLSGINLDATSFSEITNGIDEVKTYIETVNESNLAPEVKTEKIENANAILEYLVEKQQEVSSTDIEISVNAEELESKIENAKSKLETLKNEDGVIPINAETQDAVDNMQLLLYQKEQLETPTIMNVDTSQVDGDLGTVIAKVQEYQSALQTLAVQSDLKAQGVDIDTSAAQAKVDSLASEIQNISPEITAKLGIDTSSTANLQTSIQAITPEILVKAGVDQSAITNYTPEDKDSTVRFKVDSSAVDLWTAPDKSGTVTYTADYSGITNPPVKTQYVQVVEGRKATGTMLSMKSHATGTLNAHANGRVALPHDERALINEVGQESRIRNGVWELIPGGMHVEDLKKGDIIINAEQTEQLKKYGKVSGESGISAYSNGSGKFNIGGSGTKSYSSTTPQSSNKASQNKATESAKNALDAISDYFDWIKVNYDRLSRESKIAEDAIESAIGLAEKQSTTANAITKVQTELDTARRGADRYLSHANWYAQQSGLGTDIQKLVQSGTIDISKYDEDTKKKISEYQKYYELYLDSLDKVTDLQKKEIELAQKRLENIEDFYELVTSVSESIQKSNDALLKYEEAMGFSAVSDSVKKVYENSIEEAKKIEENAVQQLVDYQAEFNDLVAKGYIKEGSDAYLEGQAKIHEFTESVFDAKTSLIEFQDKLQEIEYKKIQFLIDGFERAVSKLDKWVSLQESRDNYIPEKVYQEQIDTNNAKIKENYNLRNKKVKEQGFYDVKSERYQELAEEINKLDEEILDTLADNEKLKDSIFELRIKPLEDAIDSYKKLHDEIDDFQSLLDKEAFFDKNGLITDEGLANLALLQQGMNTAKQTIADYRVGLEKLQKSFDNNVISEKEYNEKSEEYRKGIRDSIKDVKDYEDSLKDLYITQMKTEIETLNKVIDKRKEALDRKEKYYAYDKKIKSQSKDVNTLKAEIAALEGVNNAVAQSELRRKKEELKKAEEELNETKRQHSVDMQKEGYDGLSKDMEKLLEDTEYEVIHNAEKQQSVIQSMLNNVVNMYDSAYGKINQIIGNTGWVGSSDFNSNQSELGTQSGASNQVNNALTKPPVYNPSDIANGIVTSPIKDNASTNNKIEHDIMQKPNVDNRPVAELTVNPMSISIQEGQQKSVTTAIRPTDAKNKTLSWGSSNISVASVSNGTIKALKPGSCQIIVATTDGSGISKEIAVTVTKKPDPPKPQPSKPSGGGGDGIPRVGDRVTLNPGQSYYYDSWGQSPAGNLFAGVPGGVIIDGYSGSEYGGQSSFHGAFGVHIKSADGRYGDLGWVRLDQISGYKKGSKSIPNDQLAFTHDNEIIIRKSDGGVLRQVNKGDAVFTDKMSDNLMSLINNTPSILNAANLGLHVPQSTPNVDSRNQSVNVNLHYDNFLNIDGGTITKESVQDIKQLAKEATPYIVKNINKELRNYGAKSVQGVPIRR